MDAYQTNYQRKRRLNMKRVQAIRRLRLMELVEKHGAEYIAKRMRWRNTTFISQMAGPNPSRKITELTARTLEEKLELEHLFLDT